MNDYIHLINQASERIYSLVRKTSLDFLPILSEQVNNQIYIKREEEQEVHSFKIRGAYNKILSLSKEDRSRGLITASAGNHAQGVASSAISLDLKAIIVMPITTPKIKIQSVKNRGGEVLLHGDTFNESLGYALKLAEEKSYSFIHPYDDAAVIAGQGTIGKEIFDQWDNKEPIDYIFVSVGGGGLIAGISTYIKKFSPHTKIIAVEAEDSACFQEALKAGKEVDLDFVGLFADGISVKRVGSETFRIAKDLVDVSLTVGIDEVCAAIGDIFEQTRIISETGSATAFAGMKKYIKENQLEDKSIVVINSGSNINFDRLRYIAEQNEIGESLEAIFSVQIPEKKGSFKKLCKLLSSYSISEFNYRFSDGEKAYVFVGLKIINDANNLVFTEEIKKNIFFDLESNQFAVVDLTFDNLAKNHIRYMIGGKESLKNERTFEFIFPEKPKALVKFLELMGSNWDISLFHYRNHGAAFGRVFVGFRDYSENPQELIDSIARTGYSYEELTERLSYQFFLKK